jgi:hypothetical protein
MLLDVTSGQSYKDWKNPYLYGEWAKCLDCPKRIGRGSNVLGSFNKNVWTVLKGWKPDVPGGRGPGRSGANPLSWGTVGRF